jgi:hypothetical protein
MTRYCVLLQPAANRVYARSAPSLGRAELALLDEFGLHGRLGAVTEERRGGVPYLTFAVGGGTALTADEVAVVSNLSCLYALFELDDVDRLRPVELERLDRWDDDLLTIQRYGGKTNEQLTKLLVNLALVVGSGGNALGGTSRLPTPADVAARSTTDRPTRTARLRLLDPLCGRGTTLNQVVLYGLDAVGLDADPHAVDAYVTFFTTWLKNKRAAHRVERQRVRRDGRVVGHRVAIEFAATRAEQHAGAVQHVDVIADDTARSQSHLGDGSVDAIVADLPYGIQHASRAGSQVARRPIDLLTGALPVWRSVLRPGGAMALAWNRKTLAPPTLHRAIDDAGLQVVDRGESFVHEVDRSITRDIVVARRAP